MRAYEHHVARHGHPPHHQMMKELLAGFATAEIDKLFETHGLNWLDKERAKQMAVHQAHKVGVCMKFSVGMMVVATLFLTIAIIHSP